MLKCTLSEAAERKWQAWCEVVGAAPPGEVQWLRFKGGAGATVAVRGSDERAVRQWVRAACRSGVAAKVATEDEARTAPRRKRKAPVGARPGVGRLTQEAKARMRLDFARGRAAVASGVAGEAGGEGQPNVGEGVAERVGWAPTEEEEEMEREWEDMEEWKSVCVGGARERTDVSTRRQGGWENAEEAMEEDGWEQTGGEAVEPLARGAEWDDVGVG